MKQQFSDTDRRPIILEVQRDGESLVLINFYNTNTEPEYFKTLVGYYIDELSQIVYVCDFNFFVNSQSEADGGNPNFKSKSFEKILKYEKLQICVIFIGKKQR